MLCRAGVFKRMKTVPWEGADAHACGDEADQGGQAVAGNLALEHDAVRSQPFADEQARSGPAALGENGLLGEFPVVQRTAGSDRTGARGPNVRYLGKAQRSHQIGSAACRDKGCPYV